jgi:hypothetical protein
MRKFNDVYIHEGNTEEPKGSMLLIKKAKNWWTTFWMGFQNIVGWGEWYHLQILGDPTNIVGNCWQYEVKVIGKTKLRFFIAFPYKYEAGDYIKLQRKQAKDLFKATFKRTL